MRWRGRWGGRDREGRKGNRGREREREEGDVHGSGRDVES